MKMKMLKLAHDVRIDFEAKDMPVKGLEFETFGADGKPTRHTVSGTRYEPEPRVLPAGIAYESQGLWLDLAGGSWREYAESGNPGALQYAFRRAAAGLPDDDRVLYGHTRGFDPYAYMLHESEVCE